MSTRRRILERLAQGPCSGQDLAQALGLSRAAVWKAIEGLRSEGLAISAEPGRGYRLENAAGFGPATLSWRCKRDVVFHAQCTSTNTLAFALGMQAAPGGTTVVADHQTGGRGRLGRAWSSPAGVNLTFSMVLRPSLPPRDAPLLCLAAAVAVAEVLDERIKWPNDVLDASGRKLAGILAEVHAELDLLHFLVLGVGINVNQEEFPSDLPNAAAVCQRQGKQDRAALLGRLVEAIEDTCQLVGSRTPRVLDRWRARSWTLGRRVRVAEAGVEGEAIDLRDDGALLVLTSSGIRPVLAGDVTLVSGLAL
jgi:BirA family biotin operon repressor/biotin-[acetyl-CoA-carboxylase] ligase